MLCPRARRPYKVDRSRLNGPVPPAEEEGGEGEREEMYLGELSGGWRRCVH